MHPLCMKCFTGTLFTGTVFVCYLFRCTLSRLYPSCLHLLHAKALLYNCVPLPCLQSTTQVTFFQASDPIQPKVHNRRTERFERQYLRRPKKSVPHMVVALMRMAGVCLRLVLRMAGGANKVANQQRLARKQ